MKVEGGRGCGAAASRLRHIMQVGLVRGLAKVATQDHSPARYRKKERRALIQKEVHASVEDEQASKMVAMQQEARTKWEQAAEESDY